MTKTDISEVSVLMAALHRTHREFQPDIYIETDKPFADSDLLREIDDSERIILVAESDKTIAGFCIVINKTPQNPLCFNRKIAFIEAIYVRDDMRRRGIGNTLYTAALDKAKKDGADSIELIVCSLNKTALCFYEQMGMRVKNNVMETKI
jgi:ribosomal protein S18 acetylase RimI-like enzyme